MDLVEQPVSGRAVVPGANVEPAAERTEAPIDVTDAQRRRVPSLQADDLPPRHAGAPGDLVLGQPSTLPEQSMQPPKSMAVHAAMVAMAALLALMRSNRRYTPSVGSDAYRVEMRTVGHGPTALGSAGPFTLVADRPQAAGGGGLGFSGGQLLYLAIAACISNDLYREAASRDISLASVEVTVDGDFPARGAPSTPIEIRLSVTGDASNDDLEALVDEVDRIAEIPNSIRGTTPVTIVERRLSDR